MRLYWEFNCVDENDNKWDEIFISFKTWVSATFLADEIRQRWCDLWPLPPGGHTHLLQVHAALCHWEQGVRAEVWRLEHLRFAERHKHSQYDSQQNNPVKPDHSTNPGQNLWIYSYDFHTFASFGKKKRSTVTSGPVQVHTDFLQTKPRAVTMTLHRPTGNSSTRLASCIIRKSNSADWQQVTLQFPAAHVYIYSSNIQSRTRAPHHREVELSGWSERILHSHCDACTCCRAICINICITHKTTSLTLHVQQMDLREVQIF